MDPEDLFKYAAQLGVGGILGAFIFMVAWRYVTQQVREGKEDKKILIDLVANVSSVITKNSSITDNNTTAIADMERAIANNTTVINELRLELSSRRRNVRED